MRVLAWPGFQYFGINPYTNLLYRHLQELGVTTDDFSLNNVLFRRYDVFHFHWPEYYITRRNPLKAAVGTLGIIGTLCWQHTLGAKIVWTVHNLRSHDQTRPKIEKLFWSFFTRSIDGFLCLTDAGRSLAESMWPILNRIPGFVIPHGHYRNQYLNRISRDEARTALNLPSTAKIILHFGSLAPYKNVPTLVRAFRCFDDHDAVLVIAGSCESSNLANEMYREAVGDPRIKFFLGTVPEDRVQIFFNAADLVALPFTEILNSGSAILALSFNRPVLVPAQGAIPELQNLVGTSWVKTYVGTVDRDVLRTALEWGLQARKGMPDLSPLEWTSIAKKTYEAYQAMVNDAQHTVA